MKLQLFTSAHIGIEPCRITNLFGYKDPARCISSATVKKNTEIQFTNTGQICPMSTSTVWNGQLC